MQIFIALGSNLYNKFGTSQKIVSLAMSKLEDVFGAGQHSAFYRSDAFPKGSGPDYVNTVSAFETSLAPQDLLGVCHDVEEYFGRERDLRWGPRVLDVDLLAAGQAVQPDLPTQTHWRNLPIHQQTELAPDQLILPHPRLQDRAFVLGPWLDVAPDWFHPVLGLSVSQMHDRLSSEDRASISQIKEV